MQAQKHGQHVIILFIFRCQDGTEMKNILAFDVGKLGGRKDSDTKRKALNAVKFKLIRRMFAIGKQKRTWEVLNTSDDRKNLHIEKSKASEL